MSSTPKCLQNPTLRQINVPGYGRVVLDRTSSQDYTIYKDGVRLGRVYHARGWRAEGDDGYYSTRADAISMAITTWYCARKARSC